MHSQTKVTSFPIDSLRFIHLCRFRQLTATKMILCFSFKRWRWKTTEVRLAWTISTTPQITCKMEHLSQNSSMSSKNPYFLVRTSNTALTWSESVWFSETLILNHLSSHHMTTVLQTDEMISYSFFFFFTIYVFWHVFRYNWGEKS